MLKLGKGIKPEEVVEVIIRRRWFIIIPFCLSMLIGIYLAFSLPRMYRASTLILVEPQRVPANYVRPVVSSGVEDRLSTITQQVMSRSNLEKIVNEFNIYSDPGQENMFMEDKIANMRKRITVNLTRTARRGSEAFSILYKGKDPEKVMKVANALANYFIDQNLKARESQAVGTSTFLETELAAKKRELEIIEETLKKYRQDHMGELPEQLETNLRILDRLQNQISEKQGAIGNLRNNLVMLNSQKEALQSTAKVNLSFNSSTEIIGLNENDSEDLGQLKAQLEQLKYKYTDRHPDVVQLKMLISKLENKEKSKKEINSKKTPELNSSEEVPDISFPDFQNMQKEELNNDIKKLKAEIDDLKAQVAIYRKRVENTPKREQELLSLRRDYGNMNDSYNSLLKRKLEAEIAVNMEKQQKGEQFRILDYAQLPEKPISPNMNILFLFTLAGGLGVGFGLAFLFEYFNTSFRSPEDIESFLGIPVLATLPAIYQKEDLKKRKLDHFLSVFLITISFILLSGFAILSFKGVEQAKEFLSRFITM